MNGDIMNYTDEQLFNMGLIRDRRRRYVKVNLKTQSGLHIPDKAMRMYTFLSGKRLFIYLVFVMSLGMLKTSMSVALLMTAIALIGFMAYEKFVFYKDKTEIKLTEQDIRILESKDYIKARRSDSFTELFLVAMVILLILFNAKQEETINQIAMYAMLAISIYNLAFNALEWLKFNKKYKEIS